jgi:murein DD-endopeptidase MepM/ murein hydrolase activator NlpD
VLAAEYVNAGVAYRGFQFNAKDGKFSGTFDDEGQALQRAFIKAPLEITHVTSHYGQRLDPFGNGEGFHHGIDYGAALGTPIWSVGDGVVEYAKPNGGAGNMVKIKHLNGYETEYFHMSRFADGIRAGSRVKQKQVIGYVGSTGYSTGPHLHFGMFKNGEHVDPSKQRSTNAAPVPKSYGVEFRAFVAPLLERLKSLGQV